jgi:hypothetical protein
MRSPYVLADEMRKGPLFKPKSDETEISVEGRRHFRRAHYSPLMWALKGAGRNGIKMIKFLLQPYDRVDPDIAIKFFDEDLDEAHAARAVRELNLNQTDLAKLLERFSAIDTDLSGEIDYVEFLHLLNNGQRSVYTDHLYKMVDINNDGIMQFSEFVTMLSTFCMFDDLEIIRFR